MTFRSIRKRAAIVAVLVVVLLVVIALPSCDDNPSVGSGVSEQGTTDHTHVIANRSSTSVLLVGPVSELTLAPGQWVNAKDYIDYMYIDEFVLNDGSRCIVFNDSSTSFPDDDSTLVKD